MISVINQIIDEYKNDNNSNIEKIFPLDSSKIQKTF